MSARTSATVSPVLIAIAFAITTALGWMLAGSSSDSGTAAGEVSTKSADRSPWARRKNLAAGARRQVAGVTAAGSPEDRMRATIELATKLPPEKFGDWISGGWFNHRDGFELTLFRKVLEERWRAEDPEGFVEWCLGGTRGESAGGPSWAAGVPTKEALAILADWAVNDPDRLNTFFNKNPNEDLEVQMLSGLAKKDPALAAQRLQEMVSRGLSPNARGNLYELLDNLARTSPANLEGILGDLPASIRLTAESALVGPRLSESFEKEIRNLYARPDGWRLLANHIGNIEGMSDKLLAELPNMPDSWRNSLASTSLTGIFFNVDSEPWIHADLEGMGFTADQAKRLRSNALQGLAFRQPDQAIELLTSLDLNDSERQSAINNLFSRIAGDEDKTRSFLAKLGSEADRQVAQNAIDQNLPQQRAPRADYKDPDAWFSRITSTEYKQGSESSRLTYALRDWDREKVDAFGERFGELSGDQQAVVVNTISSQSHAIEGMVPELAGDLIADLLTAPTPETGSSTAPNQGIVRLASSTAANWARKDPTAASAWVNTLPEGESKLWAQKNLASTWNDYDPAAVRQWTRSLAPETREQIEAFIENPSSR